MHFSILTFMFRFFIIILFVLIEVRDTPMPSPLLIYWFTT